MISPIPLPSLISLIHLVISPIELMISPIEFMIHVSPIQLMISTIHFLISFFVDISNHLQISLIICRYHYVSPRRGIRFVFAPVSDRSLSLSLSLSLSVCHFIPSFGNNSATVREGVTKFEMPRQKLLKNVCFYL